MSVERWILRGKVVAVCRSRERGQPKQDAGCGMFEAHVGLLGDAHAGTEKEVSLLAKERVDQLSRDTGISFPPGAFAENLLVEGLPEDRLSPGTILRIGTAVLQIGQIGKDPGVPHSYHYKGFSLLPRFGVFARVIAGGYIQDGDGVEIVNRFAG